MPEARTRFLHQCPLKPRGKALFCPEISADNVDGIACLAFKTVKGKLIVVRQEPQRKVGGNDGHILSSGKNIRKAR